MKFLQLLKLITESDELDFDISFVENAIDSASQQIFASLWAEWMESEVPRAHELYVSMSGADILEIAPNYRKFLSKKDCDHLENMISDALSRFEELNESRDIKELYEYAIRVDNQEIDDVDSNSTPETFVFMVIMKMLGHGISWEDSHESPHFKYPYIEISYYHFESFPTDLKDDEDDDEDMIEDWEREGEGWKDEDYRDTGDDWKL